MEIFYDLVSYLGIDLLGSCETFPELLQSFFMMLFAMYIIVMTIKAVISASYKLTNMLK